jgi:hypothetical protein
MSCSCNAKYDNKVPCCCSTGKPVLCTTTKCPDAQVCNETIESDCVIYNGDGCEAIGIEDGMIVTDVIDIFLDILNLLCTTTTTTSPICQCFKVFNNASGIGGNVYWIDCTDNTPMTTAVLDYQTIYICSFSPVTSDIGLIITNLGGGICDGIVNSCQPPISYCHTVEMSGSGVFQYNTAEGILTNISLTNQTINVCAWVGSIIQLAGSGTMTVTNSGSVCYNNDECIIE